MSQKLSLYPMHLVPNKQGHLPPSALVPFCSYQGDRDMLGQKRPELGNLTVCNKFEPTILEGQLCYSINVSKLEKRPTKAGKTKGLFLLLDPSPYQIEDDERSVGDERKKKESFKVYIHTLAPFTAFGPGAFAMSTLKSLTGTMSFKELPDKQKKCSVHNREECQTDKFFRQVKANCGCVPWSIALTDKSKAQVSSISFSIIFISIRHRSSVVQRSQPV